MSTTEQEAGASKQDNHEQQAGVVLSGQLSAQNDMRQVLAALSEQKSVQNGVLRIFSKDVRGYIGVFCGSYLTGAVVGTSCEYGCAALKKLLVASQGMYAFLSLPEQQVELKQSLSISIEDILNWRWSEDQTPGLDAVIDAVAPHAGKLSVSQEAASASSAKLDEHFKVLLAWGGEAPVLSSTLSKLTPKLNQPQGPKVQVEVLQIPEDLLEPDSQPQQEQTPAFVPPPPPRPAMTDPITTQPMPSMQSPPQQAPASAMAPSQAERQRPNPADPNVTLSQPMPAYVPPNHSPAGQQQVSPSGSAPQGAPSPSQSKGAWDATQLDAIPTPKAGGQQDRLAAQRATGQHRPVTGEPSAAKPINDPEAIYRERSQELSGRYAALSTSGIHRGVQNTTELDKLVTDRTQKRDPRSFLSDAPDIAPVQQVREINIKTILAYVAGFGMVVFLCYQSINILAAGDHLKAGIAALKAGKNSQAIVDLTAYLRVQPDSDAYLYRAMAEEREGSNKDAFADYDHAIAMDNKNMVAYAGRASVHIKVKMLDEAIADCDTALRISPDFLEALKLRSIARGKKGEFIDAIADADYYLKHAPQNDNGGLADAYSSRAFAYFKMKKYEQAVADYSKALELDPKNGPAYASRAVAYKQLHDWKRALADCEKAIALTPADGSLFQIRAQCTAGSGDIDKALADIERSIKLTPGNLELYRMRGEAKLTARDFPGALEDFDYILSIRPEDKEARIKAEQCRQNLPGATPSAKAIADAVAFKAPPLQLTGSEPELLKKGYELLKQGDPDNAVKALTVAVKNNPNNPTSRRYLAYAFIRSNDDAGAASQFAALAKLQPLGEADNLSYAKALVGTRQYKEAIVVYTAVLTDDPSNFQGRQGLIRAYMASGQEAQASALIQDSISRSGNSPEKLEAFQKLAKELTPKK